MIIRNAHYTDIPWLVRESEAFAAEHNQPDLWPGDREAGTKWSLAVDHHLVLVACTDTARVGFMLGWVSAHPFNDALGTLTSALWWVAPGYRKTRAGVMLLEEFMDRGEEAGLEVYITLRSRVGDKFLRRRGFKPDELVYRRSA
jgi:ribosomal protein S18 acetylase RimI-like enzyme